MMKDDEGDRQPSSLRGRLAEVYLQALIAEAGESLAKRLGERALIYQPLFGAASGMTAIRKALKQFGDWLVEHDATAKRGPTIVGVDRDVTEVTLSLRHAERNIELPVALVAERGRAREIAVRLHHASLPFGSPQAPRTPRKVVDREHVVAADVAEHLAALRLGDVDAVVATFESSGIAVDGLGQEHDRGSGALHKHYAQLLQNERGANDWVPIVLGVADDGRGCSVEYETAKLSPGETSPKEGVMVFERGDSGLIRKVRIYDEIGY
ncbi:MAG: hypothetical protein IPG50_38890 [Myxococcales bacterium]|nr:hypothetical protein [Myxococcales bacterium]